MIEIKPQLGKVESANFGENKLTFKMSESLEVVYGEYAIVQIEVYTQLVQAFIKIRNTVYMHNECTDGSEFQKVVDICDDVRNKL